MVVRRLQGAPRTGDPPFGFHHTVACKHHEAQTMCLRSRLVSFKRCAPISTHNSGKHV